MKEGSTSAISFKFTNTGKANLQIDLVTACKCTELDWPRGVVPPGGTGEIYVLFDSTGFEGEVLKVVDIIANTEPIVVEAKFKVFVYR